MGDIALGPYHRQYRRMQFVLGPKQHLVTHGWKASEVAGGLALSSHPDLSVLTATRGSVTLTLLGYLLDPDAPRDGDAEIVGRIAATVAAGGDLFEALAPLGGRYLLIVDDGEPKVVGDANGTMQLFHATAGGETWCAAQPDLLAELHGFDEDPEATLYIRQFMAGSSEYSFPLSVSPYAEVRRLLPNHSLHLRSGTTHRYWPNEPRVQRSVAEVKGRVAARLSGLIAAAANRFELTLGVSAGLDSRLMLAASHSVKDRIVYYSGVDKVRGPRHPDVKIPRRMLADLGLEHHMIAVKTEASRGFSEVFRASVPYAHQQRIPGLESQFEYYQLNRVAAIGNVSENARARYQSALAGVPDEAVTARALALRRGLDHLNLYVESLQRHLDGLGDTHGYDPLDLLFWEHGSGAWFSHNVSEFVIAWQDVFLPYNCRTLLVDMLSTPQEARTGRAAELYIAVAGELWPEVLAYPINPLTAKKAWSKNVYRPLRALKRSFQGLVASLLGASPGR